MLGLHALAVRVQFLRQFADALLLRLAAQAERETDRSIAIWCKRGRSSNVLPAAESAKTNVNPAAQNAKVKSIVAGEHNQLAVWQNLGIKKLKDGAWPFTVCDEALQAREVIAANFWLRSPNIHHFSRNAVAVLVTLRFHSGQKC